MPFGRSRCGGQAPHRERSAAWLSEVLSAGEPVGFAHSVLFGFARIATSARVYRSPMTPAEAASHVRSWLEQPVARVVAPSGGHVADVLRWLERLGTAGNLVTDAQIAALAIEHDAVVHTADADFLRFPGLRWWNPITGQSSG